MLLVGSDDVGDVNGTFVTLLASCRFHGLVLPAQRLLPAARLVLRCDTSGAHYGSLCRR